VKFQKFSRLIKFRLSLPGIPGFSDEWEPRIVIKKRRINRLVNLRSICTTAIIMVQYWPIPGWCPRLWWCERCSWRWGQCRSWAGCDLSLTAAPRRCNTEQQQQHVQCTLLVKTIHSAQACYTPFSASVALLGAARLPENLWKSLQWYT